MMLQDPGKVAKLIRLLGSDVDGEVIGAARGLRRILEAEGESLHTFAAWIEGDREPERESWADIAESLLDNLDELNDRETSFAKQMATLCRRGFEPTEKQAQWLAALYERVTEGAPA